MDHDRVRYCTDTAFNLPDNKEKSIVSIENDRKQQVKLVVFTGVSGSGKSGMGSDTSCGDRNGTAEEPADGADQPKATVFEPYKGKKRKSGAGYVKQLSANCRQGRYTPTVDGKRIARNVYAPTEDECDVKLAELIKEMKAEFGNEVKIMILYAVIQEMGGRVICPSLFTEGY